VERDGALVKRIRSRALRALVRSDAVAALAFDAAGRVRSANRGLAKLLGRPRRAVTGATLETVVTAADATSLRALVARGSRTRATEILLNVVAPGDAPLTLACAVVADARGGAFVGAAPREESAALERELLEINNELATLSREHARRGRELERALAERERAQAALVHREKMASLGRMTAGVAHEINNPLAFVLSNHSTLQRDVADLVDVARTAQSILEVLRRFWPDGAATLEAVLARCEVDHLAVAAPRKLAANLEGLERVRQLVDDLRRFARVDEAGRKPCDLAELVRSSVRFLGPLLAERAVGLELDVPVAVAIVCDPGALQQAVANVVQNAVQASAPGQLVRVTARVEEDRAVVSVEDEGHGIAAENLPRVFEPFFTTRPVGAGTGLGLGIAHEIVSAHGGGIGIDSTRGQGTGVWISLPLKAAPPEEGGLT
jgi:signal transduction histidine kinase